MEPLQEIGKRTAETLPGLAAAAKAVAVQDHQRMLRDHARRVRESHLAQMKAAGITTEDLKSFGGEDEEMGDIIITGDVTYPTQHSPVQQPAQPSGLSKAAKAAVVGASLLGAGGLGAAIPLAIDALRPDPPTVVDTDTDTDTQYELRLVK